MYWVMLGNRGHREMRRTASAGVKADMKGGVGKRVYKVDEDPRALKMRDMEARVVLQVTPHPAKQRRRVCLFFTDTRTKAQKEK